MVIKEPLVQFCAVAEKDVLPGFAEKGPLHGHIVVVQFHGPLLGRKSGAGEEEKVGVHALDGPQGNVAGELVPGGAEITAAGNDGNLVGAAHILQNRHTVCCNFHVRVVRQPPGQHGGGGAGIEEIGTGGLQEPAGQLGDALLFGQLLGPAEPGGGVEGAACRQHRPAVNALQEALSLQLAQVPANGAGAGVKPLRQRLDRDGVLLLQAG